MQEGRAALQTSIMDQLPLDLTHKKHTAAAAAATEVAHAAAAASPSSLAALPTIEEGEDDGPPEPGAGPALSIAWQYQKYMSGGDGSSTSSSSGSSSGGGGSGSFCHSYDLSRPMQPELRLAEGGGPRPAVIDVGELLDSSSNSRESQCARVYRAVERAVKALPPRTVLRVLVKSLLDRRGAWDVEKGWCVCRALSVMVFFIQNLPGYLCGGHRFEWIAWYLLTQIY